MRPINNAEKLRLQKAQTDSMMDVCQIGVYGESSDSYGDLIKTWTYGSNVKCGVEILNGYEKIDGVMVYTGVLCRVRLPIDTVISPQDKIKFAGVEYGGKGISGKYCLVVDCEGVSV